AEFRSDGREARLHVLDLHALEVPFEPLDDPLASDQTGAGEVEIEITEDLALGQVAREAFQLVQTARRETSADDGADRGTSNDVRDDPDLSKCPEYADVGPSPRRAAPQCNANFTACHFRTPRAFAGSEPSELLLEPLDVQTSCRGVFFLLGICRFS